MKLPSTVTSQTVGPFFSIGLNLLAVSEIAGPDAKGERFTLEGRVLDANREPVPDAVLEVWQADAAGNYGSEEFRGFGRIPTDKDGQFRFTSIKPGPLAGANGKTQAPHLNITLFMRGLMRHLTTRVYFPDEETANAADPVLQMVPEGRRKTIIATANGNVLRWDVLLQGEDETVFFDV